MGVREGGGSRMPGNEFGAGLGISFIGGRGKEIGLMLSWTRPG